MGMLDDRRVLGRTGLKVGQLGVAGGYGAPAAAFEMAFERGCNYFYHSSPPRPGMTEAIRTICRKGMRSEIVVVAQIYTRWPWQAKRGVESFLKMTDVGQIDVLLLGWHNSPPAIRMLVACRELREKGTVRFIGVSGHNRNMFPEIVSTLPIDVFHVRYNAAHRGAEREIFPKLPKTADSRAGIVAYTATRWGNLVDRRRVPKQERVPRAGDCYRFVLANPAVDVCVAGPRSVAEMQDTLNDMERGPLSYEDMAWMRKVGDHIHKQNPFVPPFFYRQSKRK
jgi:aryl-alcohol dehydrogenase-like predicted oxidoreductase